MDILVVVIDSQDRLKQQNALLSVPDFLQVGPWLKVNRGRSTEIYLLCESYAFAAEFRGAEACAIRRIVKNAHSVALCSF